MHVIVVPARRAESHSRVKEQTTTSQKVVSESGMETTGRHQIVKRMVTRGLTKLFSEKICRRCHRVVRRGHRDSGKTKKV